MLAMGKRKSLRLPRLAQLSPVKESILCSPPETISQMEMAADHLMNVSVSSSEKTDSFSIDIEQKPGILV